MKNTWLDFFKREEGSKKVGGELRALEGGFSESIWEVWDIFVKGGRTKKREKLREKKKKGRGEEGLQIFSLWEREPRAWLFCLFHFESGQKRGRGEEELFSGCPYTFNLYWKKGRLEMLMAFISFTSCASCLITWYFSWIKIS